MKEGHFEREEKISRKQAERLVLNLANYSDWQYRPGSTRPFRHLASLKELEHFCKNEMDDEKEDYANIELNWIVEKARIWTKGVYYFENQISVHSWRTSGSAQGSVSVPDPETGGWTTPGEGFIIGSDYQAKFHHAFDQLQDAIKHANYTALEQALSTSVSSIGSYIRYRSYIWNVDNPTDPLVDNKNNKASYEEKIDEWIPKMSKGRRLDKSGQIWQDFSFIQDKRDNAAVHAKRMAYSVTNAEFAALANKFTKGIAGLLFEMHKLFGEMTPSNIIKLSYAPKVVWVPGID